MHACIAALGSGTPVIAVAYSGKFEGLFTTLGYSWVVRHRGVRDRDALALVEHALADLPRLPPRCRIGTGGSGATADDL